MPPSKAKTGATKGKSGGKVKNGLVMPKINGVDNAAEVDAAKGVGYYSGPTPPASVYRVSLRMMFVKMNKSDDLRFTWVADISEESPARKKYNGYAIMNGENYSQQGLPYVNAMLDAMGLDRDAFHNGGIRVDDPRIDLSDKMSKQVVEAVGKQSIGEDAGIVFYVATKRETYNNEERLAHVQYMDEDAWERAVAGAGGAEDDDEDDTEDVELEDDEDEEDDAEESEDDDDADEDEEEDDDDEEDDEDDEDEEEDDDDEEDDEDDEPDLSELPLKDLKARVVADDRWTDFNKTANLKGYEKDTLVDMLQNGPQKPEKAKKGKAAKKGASKVPF